VDDQIAAQEILRHQRLILRLSAAEQAPGVNDRNTCQSPVLNVCFSKEMIAPTPSRRHEKCFLIRHSRLSGPLPKRMATSGIVIVNKIRRIILLSVCAVTAAVVVVLVRRERTVLPVVIDNAPIADAGVLLAVNFTGAINDPASLRDLREAIEARGGAGLAAKEAQLAALQGASESSPLVRSGIHFSMGRLHAFAGHFDDAVAEMETARSLGRMAGVPGEQDAFLTANLGLIALRIGEVENCINCIGPSSCILPIARSAVHAQPRGSRRAIEYFTEYLKLFPGDLRIRWVLNIAYMTLGEYPEKVPPLYLIPINTFESTIDIGRFDNVASLVGLTSRGPGSAGGSVFDDFNGDNLPDLFVTSLDTNRGASLFVNRGDGTFEDCSDIAGLSDQVYALNVTRADFDNDGNLDVLLLRGGWEKPMRLSLLRNMGDGTFDDVTVVSGLTEPVASESAAWGDYDNDGYVDLFVCAEFVPPAGGRELTPQDPPGRCRLYRNEGNGKFVELAHAAGVNARLVSKGSAWGDFDDDGWVDLFVSNKDGAGRLFRNRRDGTFHDVTSETGVTGPRSGFSCWFWDFDNDGRLDLYVNDYSSSLAEYVAALLKIPPKQLSYPCLYRNIGGGGFRDVSSEVGLDRVVMPMGANFADIDNDGYLDIYLGCGQMNLESLVPNLMFRNDAGRRFDDVTISSGTGHLQKGHGISFADWDHDGDLDLFVNTGGAAQGDLACDALFQNPGHGHHWLKVKLVGTTSNRSALGARITATVPGNDGKLQTIYRTVGNNGSFGGNCLVESLGLLDAARVKELKVSWPVSGTTQTFRDISVDQEVEIIEGVDSIRLLPHQQVRAASHGQLERGTRRKDPP
jgi:hypothetical protein